MSNTATGDAAIVLKMTAGEFRVFLRPLQYEGRSAADAARAVVRDMLAGWFVPELE